MNTEFGSIFAPPDGFPYSDFGVYIGATKYRTTLNPDAIKGHYSHFHQFGPWDSLIGFPYSALRTYEAQQIAAGKPGIFITAIYEGKRRPVINRGSLKLNSYGTPTSSPYNWVYPVNVRDQRFISFWINKYALPVVINPMLFLGHPWVYVDGCTLLYSNYGVLDDSNHFVTGVKWDSPFPQSGSDYQSAITTFFNAVHVQAPQIKMMVDRGSVTDPSLYQTLFANVPGLLEEDTWRPSANHSGYVINNWVNNVLPWFSWFGAQGRIGVMGAFLPTDYESGALLTAFVTYEIEKGVNFFFAPRVNGIALPLSAPWLGWTAKLGSPVGTYTSSYSNRFFSRQYTNGHVYLNWTGGTHTVTLPSGTWYDPNGNRVTALTVATWRGSFAHH